MRWLFGLLYGATPREFESVFDLEESVRRLLAATEQPHFGGLTHEAAVGHVSKSHVSLQRVVPLFNNSFKPFYVGAFREIDGRVLLTGRFTMSWWVKALMTVWFGMFAMLTASGIAPLLMRDTNEWWIAVVGAGMFALGLGLLAWCKLVSYDDIPWLSKVIEDALSKEPPNSRFQSVAPQAARA